MKMNQKKNQKKGMSRKGKIALASVIVLFLGIAAAGGAMLMRGRGGEVPEEILTKEITLLPLSWPSALNVEANDEPPFTDDPNRTNNAFNVIDFGEQGNNGWFYRYGSSKRPQRAKRITNFNNDSYYQNGANGLEVKRTFIHTAEGISPILEWRVAEDGEVFVDVTYVKSVNGDQNPSYPDGVQLMVYQGDQLLKMENVDISTEEEVLSQIRIDHLSVKEDESLYFVVDPKSNNAFDGGSLYVAISDHDREIPSFEKDPARTDNNANSVEDFGKQGSNGWFYMYGKEPMESTLTSHENNGEYINATSPNLTISQGFIHPAVNDNAVLGWIPAVDGEVDLRVRYTKFEQNDGNPDFPDGVKIKVYKNNELLYEEHVDAPDEGENKLRHHIPRLNVTTSDRLLFMVDAEGNSSYDGGAFDITVIDVRGLSDESGVSVSEPEVRQNFADVKDDFGRQGSNGWIFQWSWWDDPFNAYNMEPYDQGEDRYFHDSYLEIKRDYVNPGAHDRSAVIKWKVAQNGSVSIRASYTKMKNEDANPAWPDGTRVSIYLDDALLTQETFAPEVNEEVTKRLDVSSVQVRRGQYISMVVNSLDNTAYDGGKYEFAISSLSGLVGSTERDVPAYPGGRDNFASTMDDFGAQGNNGWYYQYGYYNDPFFAVNIENCENNEKYLTSNGIEIKKDYIVPGTNGRSANVKWVAARNGRINIDLEYTKLLNEDANPAWPDGVTVYLMKNGEVLRQEYFAPRTDAEIKKSLSVDNVSVNAGDCITMIVDPGDNNAYDGGKYMFVIEDADQTPGIYVGNHDNDTVLGDLASAQQGLDGWWFLEGRSPGDAKVLTKRTDDGTGFNSRRTEGLEIKKDYVHAGATRDPIYLWIAGQSGSIDVWGNYVKFGQMDSNPSLPDGVTLKIYLNGNVIFSRKVDVFRGDGNDNIVGFNFDRLNVNRGDRLYFQICADGNYAWDAGRLSVVIEPTSNMTVAPGPDNTTALADLDDFRQGADGWWFFEGKSPSDARLLTRKNDDGSAYLSKRTGGLEMKKDYVHTGEALDPIYQWVVAKDGKIDVAGSYVKFSQMSDNPSYPDGVTVKIFLNGNLLLSQKVNVLYGEGLDNTIPFSFDGLNVKRGDKLSFQICADGNNSYDAGRLSVVIEPTSTVEVKPGEDNKTSLTELEGLKQGADGWWFLEGKSPADAKLLTKQNEDKSAFISQKTNGLEMKKDYVHPGATLDPIYQWVIAKDGKIDVAGSYVKFGHNSDAPSVPDGVTLRIWHNNKKLLEKKVNVLQGDGNDNSVSFSFDELKVKKGDKLSFQISCDKNNAWDAGRLSVAIADSVELDRKPGDDNNTVLGNLENMEQGEDGWWFLEGTDLEKVKLLTARNEDKSAYLSARDAGLEMKKDYVHPGSEQHAIYQWVVAEDDKLFVRGNYVKFGHNDEDPDHPDGITLTISLNDEELLSEKVDVLQGDGNDNKLDFSFKELEVKEGDIISFAISANENNAYDAGRLSVSISSMKDDEEVEPDPNRTNNTVLAEAFGQQGSDRWRYGMCDWDGKNFEKLHFDSENNRYYNDGKPELKADFVEPGNGRNAAYEWEAACDGTIVVKGEYVKFVNTDDPEADGTTFRIFVNGEEKKWIGGTTQGQVIDEAVTSFEEIYEVKAGDKILFAVNPEGNDSYDGGRLAVTISEKEEDKPDDDEVEPDPNRTNNTVLADAFGKQGSDGWRYGMCDWDSKNFEKLPFDSENNRYYNNGKPELKADFVEPGNGRNAAYEWEAACDGTIVVKGEYVKFVNTDDPEADGTTFRIFVNGEEKKWIGGTTQGQVAGEVVEAFEENYEVKAGDKILFAVNPEGNDSYDGGRLAVTISEKVEEDPGEDPGTGGEVVQPDPERTNSTSLAGSFGAQGSDGWTYGMCEWDGADFTTLSYDPDNGRYYNNGKPELKADFVEPGNWKSAAYRWEAAQDGKILVDGEYVKFVNTDDPNADGTCLRIFLNGEERKWIGTTGSIPEERQETFHETYDVKAGDLLLFAVSPESNDSYDGGRLAVTISPIEESGTDNTGDVPLSGAAGPRAKSQTTKGTDELNPEGRMAEKVKGRAAAGEKAEKTDKTASEGERSAAAQVAEAVSEDKAKTAEQSAQTEPSGEVKPVEKAEASENQAEAVDETAPHSEEPAEEAEAAHEEAESAHEEAEAAHEEAESAHDEAEAAPEEAESAPEAAESAPEEVAKLPEEVAMVPETPAELPPAEEPEPQAEAPAVGSAEAEPEVPAE